MCRYKSEGDPKGRSDCDSLRDDNELVHRMNEKLREEIRKLREERRCVWTDYDGSQDFDTACGEKHSILPGLELYDYCPFCGGLVEQQDACEQELDEPLPPGPEVQA